MGWFLKETEALGPQLGCFLVQLPPDTRKSLPVLETFLRTYGEHRALLVLIETDEEEAVMEITASFVYIRLRKWDFSGSDLAC